MFKKLDKASTHKSAKTHADNVFCDCWHWPFDHKINGFSALNVEHFYIKLISSNTTIIIL